MPQADRPLTRTEIATVLRNIVDHPDNIPPAVALEAMAVTAHTLLGSTDRSDVPLPTIAPWHLRSALEPVAPFGM